MKTKLSHYSLALFACLSLSFATTACSDDSGDDGSDEVATEEEDSSDDADEATDTETGTAEGTEETTEETTEEESSSEEETTTEEEGMGTLPNGSECTNGNECLSGECYLLPFLGGQCGECDEDDDCPDGGCTIPNPFDANGSICNEGEVGGGCESDEVCQDGLSCGTVLDLLGLITISTCGNCATNDDCTDGQICEPVVIVEEFSGINDCIDPGTLEQDAYCDLMGDGDAACASGICSPVNIMNLAEVGACGACVTDDDCGGGTCQEGGLDLENGALLGSTCI
ncbi:hypothetical protein [Plesiocystis pacifica]|uniref:hypothetical protein n=1 Tax=Plesiocystis pacifica TaxID=191768 RepID=UPI0012F89219|nr:hypothetical protein [Plesiocystis pacifica]